MSIDCDTRRRGANRSRSTSSASRTLLFPREPLESRRRNAVSLRRWQRGSVGLGAGGDGGEAHVTPLAPLSPHRPRAEMDQGPGPPGGHQDRTRWHWPGASSGVTGPPHDLPSIPIHVQATCVEESLPAFPEESQEGVGEALHLFLRHRPRVLCVRSHAQKASAHRPVPGTSG